MLLFSLLRRSNLPTPVSAAIHQHNCKYKLAALGGVVLMAAGCKHLSWLSSQSEAEVKAAKSLSSMPVFHHDIQYVLRPFESCKQLSTSLREQLVKGINADLKQTAEEYDPNNPDRGMIVPMATEAVSKAGGQVGSYNNQDFTKTNNQVEGVEEGDVIATDGRLIYQAFRNEVRRFKVNDRGQSERLAPLVLAKEHYIHAIALTGSAPRRLIVVSTFHPPIDSKADGSGSYGTEIGLPYARSFRMPDSKTLVAIYDLGGANPSEAMVKEPMLADSYQFAGQFDQLRLKGKLLRVLAKSSLRLGGGVQTYVPSYDFKAKKYLGKDEYQAKTRAAIASNLSQVYKTTDSELLSGGYRYSGKKGERLIAVRQTTDDCQRIYSNSRKLGLYKQFTDVLSIDLATGTVQQDKFLIDSSDSYFTGANLYLTHHSYQASPRDKTDNDLAEAKAEARADHNERLAEGTDPNFTTIHKLAFTGLKSKHYGSVSVPGSMLDRYSMSEHNDVLRLAVTENRPRYTSRPSIEAGGQQAASSSNPNPNPSPSEQAAVSLNSAPEWESESYVYTIGEDIDGKLKVLGRVGGLGKNERIYSVRYFGDKGYVVTFRKTDPLYTLDLSDPRDPQVIGELKIPGFSTYMHGIGDGQLLAIGKDADLDGRVRGVKVSLFDVSDFAAPRLASELVLAENTHSEATYNPKAFNWSAPRNFLAIPMSYWYSYGATRRNGDKIIGVLVNDGKLERADDFSFVSDPEQKQRWLHMKRSLMVGDALYTITEFGVKGYHFQQGERR